MSGRWRTMSRQRASGVVQVALAVPGQDHAPSGCPGSTSRLGSSSGRTACAGGPRRRRDTRARAAPPVSRSSGARAPGSAGGITRRSACSRSTRSATSERRGCACAPGASARSYSSGSGSSMYFSPRREHAGQSGAQPRLAAGRREPRSRAVPRRRLLPPPGPAGSGRAGPPPPGPSPARRARWARCPHGRPGSPPRPAAPGRRRE